MEYHLHILQISYYMGLKQEKYLHWQNSKLEKKNKNQNNTCVAHDAFKEKYDNSRNARRGRIVVGDSIDVSISCRCRSEAKF